ncbi:branched-chain amino acid ABC transporter permease [Clostridium sp. KNHs216]|uniref:branched-chain amino acid ABC transporter permease n=1 Tax=Clostridium sp. KNHs216 TaxID=1550235 RepID=UPI0011698D09|nr:branched-chain amino acid ABC transporter permease [Clostridium sp. KNHs216]TQI66973.1 branched-chain amino acid transport system permease protein [Clostridium sp. KNHs216]
MEKLQKPSNRKHIAAIVAIMLLIVIPLMMEHNIVFVQSKYVYVLLCMIGIYTIVTSGLDILFGYTGQVSFGHAGFFCIGAYASVLMTHPSWGLGKWFGITLPPIISIFIAAFISALFGILLSIPASKLVFHFLALLTIAFNYLILLVVSNFPTLTNGYIGITGVPQVSIFGFSFSAVSSKYRYYYLILFFTIVFLIIKRNIIHSRVGRGFIAIRDNLTAANGCGVNVHYYKTMSFAISAFFVGFAGALYVHMIGFISPDTFVQNTSVIFMTMLLFGGSGNLVGPILGSAFITSIQEGLQPLADYRMLIYGIIILVIILFQPEGIAGIGKKVPNIFIRRGGESNA